MRRGQRVEQLGVGHLAGAGEVPETLRRLAGRRWQAQGAGIEGDRPAVPSREPVLERRHRGGDDADIDAPVVVQRRLVVERTPVGEIGRRRIQTLGQLTVASSEVTMAPAQLARYTWAPSARSGGRLGSSSRETPNRSASARLEGAHPGIEAVGRAQSFYQRQERVHGSDRVELGTGGQRRGGATDSSKKRRASSTSAAATMRPAATPMRYSWEARVAVAATRRTMAVNPAQRWERRK